MRHRGLAAMAGTLLLAAIAPAVAGAYTGRRNGARRRGPTGRRAAGFGPTTDAGPSGPRALAAPRPAAARPASAIRTSRSRATVASMSATTT